MTNEELKKKITDVLRGNIEYELHYFPDDNYTEVEFDYDKLADVLLSAGIGDIKRIANEERKQAMQEFAERVKMAFYYEFDELIPSIMADKIDALVKEECGE